MEETQKKEVKGNRPRRTFTEEFKKQMVELYNAGKSRTEIVNEYELTPSALDRWISRINSTGSTREKDNRSDSENELIALKKENKRLLLENEILKKAAADFREQVEYMNRPLRKLWKIQHYAGRSGSTEGSIYYKRDGTKKSLLGDRPP